MFKYSFVIIFSLIYSFNFGQSIEHQYCGQHAKLKESLKDPKFKAEYEAGQEQLKKEFNTLSTTRAKKRGTIYTIPIVFHVLHNGGSENISDAQIVSAMNILNADYRLKNTDANDVQTEFSGMQTDVEFEFAFATIAPNGACFNGITRTFTSDTTTDGYEQLQLIQAGNNVFKGEWTGNKYVHIYVVKSTQYGAGYTFIPFGSGKSMSNGIWISYDYVGDIGTSAASRSRALTHELGHYFNLMHTWGGTNDPGVACGDDDVPDTPETKGSTTYCPLNDFSCGSKANVENYMDYSYCSKMFTPGQADRMRTSILSSVGGRNNLCSSSNLIDVGITNPPLCLANFSPSSIQVCAGNTVTFSDQSYNAPTSWNWSFPGGTPSSSSDQNPTVTYNTPGKYTVSLAVSSNGTTKTISIDSAVKVLEGSKPIPFLEDFESYNSIESANFWDITNANSNAGFQIYSGTGFAGNKCITLQNFGQTGKNNDELISGALDLSNVKSQSAITLTYRYAYKKVTSSNSETLRLSMSADCGTTWSSRKTLIGNFINSLTDTKSWVPSDKSDWKTVHITNITSGFWNNKTRLKFSFDGSGGNNLYIDAINIYPSGPQDSIQPGIDTTLEINTIVSDSKFEISPNPVDEQLTISFEIAQQKIIHYEIIDLTGKSLFTTKINASEGKNEIMHSTTNLQPGSYFLLIESDHQIHRKYFQVI
jgi:PKD repeat protein